MVSTSFNHLLRRMGRKLPISSAVAEAPSSSEGHLKRCVSLLQVIAIGVSSTVGSGIFVTVGIIAHDLSGPSLFISMLLAILGCSLSALCFAELSGKIPAAGQAYTYCYVYFGEFWGFAAGWLTAFPYTIASAAIARGWANYLDCFFNDSFGIYLTPWLVGSRVVAEVFSISVLAPVLCIFCGYLCFRGVEESANFSLAMGSINVTLLLIFCCYGSIEYSSVGNFYPLALDGVGALGVLKGAGLACFSCVGWDTVCTLSEEVKDPQKDIPRGLLATLVLVGILYSSLSVTLCLMVPAEDIDLKAPLAFAFKIHGDQFGSILTSLTAITVCTPPVLAGLVGQPRIWYRMALDGLLPEKFTWLNQNGILYIGTFVSCGLASLLALAMNFESLASTTSATTILIMQMVCSGVITCRYKENLLKRGKSLGEANSGVNSINIALLCFNLASLAFYILMLEDLSLWGKEKLICFVSVFKFCYFLKVISLYFMREEEKLPSLGEPLLFSSPRSTGSVAGTSTEMTEYFECPFMPWLPLLACSMNSYLIGSLGLGAILGCLLWLIFGLLVYLGYGMQHSKLNRV